MAKILVIDDDESVRSMLTRVLTSSGHEIQTAINGSKVAQIMESFAPELVITDIIMPEADGLETIRELRSGFPQVHIIAISGGGLSIELDHLPIARMLGAELTLKKPIDNDKLREAIDSVVGGPVNQQGK
jgi:CheY-like chemotaxis protein